MVRPVLCLRGRQRFLTGKSGAFTGCDLGWLVNAANFEKVLSGKYHAEKREAANA